MAKAAVIEVTRQTAGVPDRIMTEPDEGNVVQVVDGTTASPEDALEQAHKIIKQRDDQLAAAHQTADQANQQLSRAQRETQRLRQTTATTQTAAVASLVETTKAEQNAAALALKSAKESGDIDAEIKATAQFTAATTRLTNAEAQLAYIKTQGDPTSGAGNVTDPGTDNGATRGPTASSQAWIDRHPRFNRDKVYTKAIIRRHEDMLDDGIQVDSAAYFRGLDEEVAKLEGRQTEDADMNDTDNRGFFSGAPPSGAQGGRGTGGGKVRQTPLGPVTVYTKTDGSKTVSVPPHLRADFEEFARINKMELGEYILDLAEGGDGDLITAEGAVYR